MSSYLPATFKKVIFALIFATSFFIILTYVLSMGLGILVVFSTAKGLEFSRGSILLYPLFVSEVEVIVNAGAYFLFLWWIFAFCFVAAYKYRQNFLAKVKELFSGNIEKPFSSNLLAMPAITSTLLVATILLHLLQTRSGIPTGAPREEEPFLDFLRFSQAPLTEEIYFRIIPIGAFLVTYIFLVGMRSRPDFSFGQRVKTCILSVLQPDNAKEIVGLKTISKDGLFKGLTWAEWIMVFLTASFFGVAHFLGGWGLGKISQAGISGAAFALAYLYYGVQASILLHWYFNYYFTVFDLSSEFYVNLGLVDSLVLSANFFLGIIIFFTIVVFGIVAVLQLVKRKPKAVAVPEPPPDI